MVISDYVAQFSIDTDGDLDAVETITGEFPGGRHGIIRYWDVTNPNDTRVRQTPQIGAVLMDGRPVPHQLLWELSGIDVELTRRAALIPGLVHTVGTFAAHEKAILNHVSDARAALNSATAGKSVTARSVAESRLDQALGPILALGQQYPQLNSSNNFLNLQQNLADTENKLAFARQYYNDAVAGANRLIRTMPWMFVAPLTGVSEREFYQTPR